MSGTGIAWESARDEVAIAATDAAVLARVLVSMGLTRFAVIARGDVPGFAPEYEAFVPWRRRLEASRTEATRGFAQGEWSPEAIARRDLEDEALPHRRFVSNAVLAERIEAAIAGRDRQDDAERAAVAERNRARRDAPVFVLMDADRAEMRKARGEIDDCFAGWLADRRRGRKGVVVPRYSLRVEAVEMPAHQVMIYLDVTTLEWRDASGGARGEDLFSLCAFMRRWSYGRAAHHVARLCGQRLRTFKELGIDGGWRGIAAA